VAFLPQKTCALGGKRYNLHRGSTLERFAIFNLLFSIFKKSAVKKKAAKAQPVIQ
jgi:hypothetical protein